METDLKPQLVGGQVRVTEPMPELFACERRMRFVIAPAGTRRYSPHVRSSFHHVAVAVAAAVAVAVAVAAKVPMLLGAFDFPNQRVVVNAIFASSGNGDVDLAAIAADYKTLGNNRVTLKQAAPWVFR